ncbi:uncharacterized protein LOC105183971 isoform X2 [Harpegnathos saltator]|uniref:uncharacterized protein LOC105183971 isoform X2 n=1 Tax=Harpegnathos saltator TaxID=610380 RepID=UPI000DBED80B|nr:uncharacterized protein LOC105183971 isoform X2 [Harpegnathos saltator]
MTRGCAPANFVYSDGPEYIAIVALAAERGALARRRWVSPFEFRSKCADRLQLCHLLNQTWNIYAASALFGFQHDDVSLKLYSKKLREEIARHLPHEDLTYDANFFIIENGSTSNYENYSAIKIEVVAKQNNHEEKSIYKGILLSWTTTQIEPDINNTTKLPLLLCRGTRNCIDAVHIVISHMFDCLVMALPISEDDLNWLIPIIIVLVDKDEQPIVSGEVHMEYTVSELPVTDTIKVKFDISELRKILKNIINQNNMANIILDHKHIKQFYEVLYVQMLTIGGLQLGSCTLHRINLPGVTIMENRMKIMNVEIMNHILLYLCEKAFDTFHAIRIDI